MRCSVLEACAHSLLTTPHSSGPTGETKHVRDGAYHQGTVWGWLVGPLVAAHLRVHGDPEAAMSLLAPFGDHLVAVGLGTVSEIFDGDAPFAPQGCIAQAWSVGEALRAYRLIEQARLAGRATEPAGPAKPARRRAKLSATST